MIRAAAEFAYRCGIVALFCAAFATLISLAEAAPLTLHLLPNSMQPASMDECAAATGKRPKWTISKQERSNEPWHHRTCVYLYERQP